jgi:hypothetical protein
MNDWVQTATAPPAKAGSSVLRARDCNFQLLFQVAAREQRFFAPGGRRNPLKRLNPDKEIQGKPSQKFCSILIVLVRTWLDLAKFGFGLKKAERQDPLRHYLGVI